MRLRHRHRHPCCRCRCRLQSDCPLTRGKPPPPPPPPPQPRARHGSDPPHPFPGAFPGEDGAPALRPGGLQGGSRSLSYQPRPRPLGEPGGAADGLAAPDPALMETPRPGWVGARGRWPHVRISSCDGHGNRYPQRLVGSGGAVWVALLGRRRPRWNAQC